MLCDDVLHSLRKGNLKYVADFCDVNIYAALMGAQKFSFSEKASAIVDGCCQHQDDFTDKELTRYRVERDKTNSFFKLPFSLMWIERHVEVVPGQESIVDSIRTVPVVSKVGLLINGLKPDLRKGEVFMFWRFKNPSYGLGMGTASMIFNTDDDLPVKSFYNPLTQFKELSDKMMPKITNMEDRMNRNAGVNFEHFKRLYEKLDVEGRGQIVRKDAYMDFTGEWDKLYWAIVTLNSKNGFSDTLVTPDVKLQKSRRMRDKLPLQVFHEIDLVEKRSNILETNPDGSFKRLHWKRGHFKTRKSGIFWWNPHLAGRKELGFVDKRYNKV